MENQEKLLQFVEWLGQNVPELKGQGPEQIVSTINELSKSDEGKQMLQGLIQEFESSMTSMFKKGGKLDYLLCLKSGGNIQDCGCGKRIDKKQPGGSIASRLWNKWTGKDKYVDGYGTTRSHVPVRESAHRTALKAADSPLVQAIPVVGDVADGYIAADYAAKGDYKPAIAAIGAGLVLPDMLESGARYIPKDTWRDALKKFDDVDLDAKLDDVTTGVLDDVKKYLDDVKSGKIKLTKDINEMTDNEKEALLNELNSNSSLLNRYRKHRTPSQSYRNTTPVDDDIDKVWIPQRTYNDADDIIDYGISKQSTEPWWGWDPVEYQRGGRVLGSDQYPNVSRKEAIDAAMDMGLSRKQARNAYRNQLRGLSSVNGLSGKELRQNARWNIIDTAYPRATESTQPQTRELAPISSVTSIDSPITVTTSQSAGIIKPKLNTERPSLLTFTGQNFDSAFSNARKMGLSEFGWNGGRYTTELDTSVPDAYETNPVDLSTPNSSVSGTTLPTSGWIAGPGYDPRVYQILKNEVANRRSKRK